MREGRHTARKRRVTGRRPRRGVDDPSGTGHEGQSKSHLEDGHLQLRWNGSFRVDSRSRCIRYGDARRSVLSVFYGAFTPSTRLVSIF